MLSDEAKGEEMKDVITMLMFDLDNTMYPRSCGLDQAMTKRIFEYVMTNLNLNHALAEFEAADHTNNNHDNHDRKGEGDGDREAEVNNRPPPSREAVDKLLYSYYKQHGITLNGLIKHTDINEKEYLEYVHEPSTHIDTYLPPPSQALPLLVSSIVQQDPALPSPERWVFTNGYHDHAIRVLDFFKVRECFDGVVDFSTMRYDCKPFPRAYQVFLETANHKRPASQPKTIPEECLFFDDTPSNLETAKQLGFHTVLVGVSESEMTLVPTKYPFVEHAIKDIYEVPSVLHFYGLKLKDGVTIPPPFLSSS